MTKKAAVICFTENGSRIAGKVKECLCQYGYAATLARKYTGASDSIQEPLSDWTGREFVKQDALIFIGAAGIAVRAIAPYVKTKTEDPAVLVIDEQGIYCIPVLSGHIGGANELAEFISDKLHGIPVITTATDLNGKWAADVFAAKNGLKIQDMKKAKEVSARLLSGESISVYIDRSCGEIQGKPPEGVQLWSEERDEGKPEPDVAVGVFKNPAWKETLYLIPRAVVLGIGCRKGKEEEKIERKIRRVLENSGIFLESVCKVSSIELKKNETGIVELCKKFGWEFETFSAEILGSAEGKFLSSEFVKKITGVDNICERSAVCASEGGHIIAAKQAEDGVTIAAAERRWGVRFE